MTPEGNGTTGAAVRAFLERSALRRAAFLLVLTLLNLPTYAPALRRYFSGDHLYYFAELHNDRSLAAGLSRWDNTSTRTMAKGDELLFRPLGYILLGVENTLFGYDYHAWNVANLILHLGVCFALFELLWALKPSAFAAAFALVFSVLAANVELVTWNHLGGYLAAFVLLLAAMLAARKATSAEEPSPGIWLAVYAAAITGAMLMHELPVVGALLFGAYLGVQRRRLPAPRPGIAPLLMATLLPLGLYAGLYVLHISHCSRWLAPLEGSAAPRLPFPVRTVQSLGLWAVKALDPWTAAIATRNFARFNWSHDVNLIGWHTLPVVALLAGTAACVRPGLTKARWTAQTPFAGATAALLLAYSAVYNLGRSQTLEITYYVYFAALLGAVLVYSLIDFSQLGRKARSIGLGLLAVMGALQAIRTGIATRALAEQNLQVVEYFDRIDAFVAEHRNEEGFAFAVRGEGRPDPYYEVWIGYPDQSPSAKPTGYAAVSTLLYPRYVDARILSAGPSPSRHKYLLEWSDSGPQKTLGR